MKRSHPDQGQIPTLRDLVFPGNQGPRPSPSHERDRIEPTLPAKDENEFSPTPFILLPDESDDSLYPFYPAEEQLEEHVSGVAESTVAHVPHTAEYERTEDTPDKSVIDGPETGIGARGETGRDSQASPTALAEADTVDAQVSIEDLRTYFYRPRPTPAPALGPGFRPPESLEPPPAPDTPQPFCIEKRTDEELERQIRAAVQDILEREIEHLTELITATVIARLRR